MARSARFSIAAGFFALLLLACVLDVSTALQLSLIERSDRNSYLVQCNDGMGGLATGATLILNATTPPSDCFNVTAVNEGMRLRFTISCEGFLQCKEGGDLSLPASKLEAYPALPDPPSKPSIQMYALEGQDEPVVFEANVQSSITGQVRVMWKYIYIGIGNEHNLSPNGDRNSLVLHNVTTADAGAYYPVATATSPSLMNPSWRILSGQRYSLTVDPFEPPHFKRSLTCGEQPQQMWHCSTRATGTGITFEWFINDELVNSDDDRVYRIVQSSITLHNLQSSDMQLMVQVHSANRDRSYRITQLAAILVPSTPRIGPSQTDGDNTSYVGFVTAGAIIGFVLFIVIPALLFIIILSAVVYHKKTSRQGEHVYDYAEQSSPPQLPPPRLATHDNPAYERFELNDCEAYSSVLNTVESDEQLYNYI